MTTSLTKVLRKFRSEIWWIGKFTSEYYFQFLKSVDLDQVSRINILTSHSRIDKEFLLTLGAFWSYCQEKIRTRKTVINIRVFLPENEPTSSEEIFIFDEESGIRTLGTNEKTMCKCVSVNAQKVAELKDGYKDGLSVSSLDSILRVRIESDFNIESRRIPGRTKEELREAILEFERSDPKIGAFELIGVYEKYVREFIKFRLSQRAPAKWYTKYVESNLSEDEKGRVNKIFREDEKRRCQQIEKTSNPLEYFDCKYYPIIIERVRQKSSPLFGDVEDPLLSDMKKIPKYRNPASHHRDAFFKDAIPLVVGLLVSLNGLEDLSQFS